MPEPGDSCRPVLLPSGEPIRVRGADPMGPEAVAALGEVVAAARARRAAEHPPDPAAVALWGRLYAMLRRERMSSFRMASQAGVAFSVLSRLRNGYMPDATDLATIEAWLIERKERP